MNGMHRRTWLVVVAASVLLPSALFAEGKTVPAEATTGSALNDKKAKIVFISGKPSHGRMRHEHRAGNLLLAKALKESGLAVEPLVVPHYGYPKDKSVLNDAATIVIFCTGHRGHVLRPVLDEFDGAHEKRHGGRHDPLGNGGGEGPSRREVS